MPSRGIPTTYPAPPFEPEDSGLIGPSPGCPVPCSNVIFSSSVISLTTIAARSSGDKLVFIQGEEAFVCAAGCPDIADAIVRIDESTIQHRTRRDWLIIGIPPRSVSS